jgi:hypothetical protein
MHLACENPTLNTGRSLQSPMHSLLYSLLSPSSLHFSLLSLFKTTRSSPLKLVLSSPSAITIVASVQHTLIAAPCLPHHTALAALSCANGSPSVHCDASRVVLSPVVSFGLFISPHLPVGRSCCLSLKEIYLLAHPTLFLFSRLIWRKRQDCSVAICESGMLHREKQRRGMRVRWWTGCHFAGEQSVLWRKYQYSQGHVSILERMSVYRSNAAEGLDQCNLFSTSLSRSTSGSNQSVSFSYLPSTLRREPARYLGRLCPYVHGHPKF